MTLRALLGPAAFVVLAACSERRSTPKASTEPSPNANILPAPLASAADLTGATGVAGTPAVPESASARASGDPEPPPEAAPVDHLLPEDTLSGHDMVGYTVEGAFRWADVPPVGPEVPATLREAASLLELRFSVDLTSTGRMRFSLESSAFPLPAHTELRARTGYYGHVLVWPGAKTYRVLPAGSLRALFAERRADVAPLLRAVLRPGGSGLLLGHRTVQTEVETSLGVLSLEQAAVPGSGGGGELLCRLLVELVGAEPTNDACRSERIPLYAQYRWAGGGSIAFVATSIGDRRDAPLPTLYVPPAGARWAPGELPPSAGALVSADDLARLKARPLHVQAAGRTVTDGVTCDNETNLLQYFLLDGVPVAWLAPRSRAHFAGPPAGRYLVAWRDFFGTSVVAPAPADLPSVVRIGTPDVDAGNHL